MGRHEGAAPAGAVCEKPVPPTSSPYQPGQSSPGKQRSARCHACSLPNPLPSAGPLRVRDFLPASCSTVTCGSRPGAQVASEASNSAATQAGISYWVLPAPSSGAAWDEQADALVAALLARPSPPFAQRCSELGWLRGAAGEVWRAVRKSADIATFYSRLARTQLKGAGGWGLAR